MNEFLSGYQEAIAKRKSEQEAIDEENALLFIDEKRTDEIFRNGLGTDLETIFSEEASNGADFLNVMKSLGMPAAVDLKIAVPKVTKGTIPKRSLFGIRAPLRDADVTMIKGYQIGGRKEVVSMSKDTKYFTKLIFLCEDGKLRESEPISENSSYNNLSSGFEVGTLTGHNSIELGQINSHFLRSEETSRTSVVNYYKHHFEPKETFSELLVSIAVGATAE